ncbi:MAG TPA: D-2-hydroxyacid dehydrogenase [Devosiaceae bacterium]|jgi:phosphoglycerate dehydrogenase-like enzyme
MSTMADTLSSAAGQMRTISKVLSTVPYKPDELEQLRRAFAPAEFIWCPPTDNVTIEKALEAVDVAVIAGDLDDRYVAAPHLKWVHCDHSGLTRSARADVFDKGLIVTGSAGRSAEALAQHAFYFALALTFEGKTLHEHQKAHIWRGIPGYQEKLGLPGKTLGVVGYGRTGAAMAALGKAFGMKVIVYTRSAVQSPANADIFLVAENGDSIDQLVEKSDVIMLATQLTDATYHMFSTEQFKRMKPTSFIVNMARGGVIDQDALVAALTSGEIAGAGLDVFATEPLPADSPVWDAPNLMVTPHATPGLPDKTQRSIDVIVANAGNFRAGRPMVNAITRKDVFTPR